MFTNSGINIFHVSAQIGQGYLDDSYYYTIFNYNNTDTDFKILNIVEADMNESIETYAWVENSDLFQVGQTLNDNVYPNYMWYDNTPLGYTISIQSLTDEGAQLLIIEE
jgi:oxalate decarboxylase/phosphoglucose isomerase-like protein (cupin superfamily)